MASSRETQYRPETVSTPGEILEELLEERGMTQVELAQRTGRPTKTINEIVKGKSAVTTETALQFERVFGVPARFWNNLEQNYREHLARLEERKRLRHQTAWLKLFPLRAMIERGWIEKRDSEVDLVAELLTFFGVSSAGAWKKLLGQTQAAFRQSSAFEVDRGALAAWLRQGELEAQSIDCMPFDQDKFKAVLKEVRALTTDPPEAIQDRLREVCATAGVAVVFVPEMPKSRASGATRWLAPEKALVQLSLRYKTDDHLWFTFFHECAHLLRHGKKLVFLEGEDAEGHMEEEANRFAASFLIPNADYQRLLTAKSYTCQFLRAFANELGIAPGIVVGRLQHDGVLPFSQCNSLKRRLTWSN